MHPMDVVFLVARSLSNDKDGDDNSSKKTCPVEDTTGPVIVPFISNLTYHEFATILSGACAAASTLMVGVLIVLHACNYSNPVQQRQIIRIIMLVPWVALFSFLIVWQDTVGEYFAESLDFGCSMALSAFLLFMCDCVLSHQGGFNELFGNGTHVDDEGSKKRSPVKLKTAWYGVLQFVPVSILTWVVTASTLAAGTYCKQSNSPRFAHIWMTVLLAISASAAIINSLKFYSKHKETLSAHRILLKLFTFKGIIGLNALQKFIIGILAGQDILKATSTMSYHDVNTGLSALILACEMPIFAILIVLAFPVSPYKNNGPAAGPLNAIVDAFNITDLLSAFYRGPMRLVRNQQRQIMRQNSMRIAVDEGMQPEEYQGGQTRVMKPAGTRGQDQRHYGTEDV